MIFSSEQPQTGMNEGTWFTQGMCIKNEGIISEEGEGVAAITFFTGDILRHLSMQRV